MPAAASTLSHPRLRVVDAVSARSNSSGLTSRTSSSGTSANNIETSAPTASPCPAADHVTPIDSSPTRATTDEGMAAIANAAMPTPNTPPPIARPTICNT